MPDRQLQPQSPTTRRFASTVRHYVAGRPAYPPRLIARVAALCSIGPAHRILDLGCGPAQLAIAFAPYVGAVLAMDPEPEMLKAAAAAATAAGVGIDFIEAGAAELDPALAPLRMVTIGRAFHWMDRADTLRRLDDLLEPEGAVVLFDDTHPKLPDNVWQREFWSVVERYSVSDPERARRRAPEWLSHEAILLASPFALLERVAIIERRRVTVDLLVDRALSMSSTSPALLGAKAEALAAELRGALAAVAPDGALAEVVEIEALIARRP